MHEPIDYESRQQPQRVLVNKNPWLLIIVVMVVVAVALAALGWVVQGRRVSASAVAVASPPVMPVVQASRLPAGPTQYEVSCRILEAKSQLSDAQRAAKLAELIIAAYQDGTLPAINGEPTPGESLFITLLRDPAIHDATTAEKFSLARRMIREGYPESMFVQRALPKEK